MKPESPARIAISVDRTETRVGVLPHHLHWHGEGPEPRTWTADDGTIVYRSYADYCDD